MTAPERAMDFEVTSRALDDRASLVTLAGESDMYTAPEFEEALFAAIERGSVDVIVDLTTTTFFDSTNLAVLLRAGKRLQELGGRLAIVSTDRNVNTVFEITSLDRVFAIYPTVAAARDESFAPTNAQAR